MSGRVASMCRERRPAKPTGKPVSAFEQFIHQLRIMAYVYWESNDSWVRASAKRLAGFDAGRGIAAPNRADSIPKEIMGVSGWREDLVDNDALRALADVLRSCRAAVVLTGYPSTLYDDELDADWHRTECSTYTGQGNHEADRNDRGTEVLWGNRPLGRCQLYAAGW